MFGCTGFLGRYVVYNFGRIGTQTVIPYRGEESSYTHLKVMGDLGQIVPYKWDIRDKESIRQACKFSNVVVNVVGRTWDTRNFTMHETHVDGAARIAEVVKELGIERLIHVSALGASTDSECEWLKTKAQGEQAVKSIFPRATIIRPATLWGAQDKFLNTNAQMLRYWPLFLLVNGQVKMAPIWVNDVATAMINSLKTQDAVGQTYELAGPEVLSQEELARWMDKVLKTNKKFVLPNEEVIWHLTYWLGLHRVPRFTEDGVKNTVDKVLSGKFPGITDLGVKPTPLKSPLGINCFLHYRPPIRQYDITMDAEPEVEPEVGLSEGHPLY